MDHLKVSKPVLFALGCVLAILSATMNSSAGTITVKLTGVNGATQGGVYVDPYYGTINNVPGILVCDDFSHETHIGESWQVNVSTFDDLISARFQQGTQAQTLQDYEEAAYLYEQLLDNPSQYGDISFALWSIFTPGAKTSSGFTANSQDWLTQAQDQSFYAGEFSNFRILTPADPGPGSPQEFLTVTPEPASVVLLFSGLFAIAFLLGKKRLLA
ncbi:MAG: PEP-CTERM sorting domain-containing protein [Terriglobia bacterium]